jgi:carbamate kinase
MPGRIIQSRMIRSLVYAGNVVLALGGGGVPITKDAGDRYVGVEAVIDKDLSSALLATDVKADLYVILTGTEKVCLNYGQPEEQPLDQLTWAEAKAYFEAGHFPPGSMGPKIQSAMMYLEAGGREVIITNPENLDRALNHQTGTRLVWR